MGLFGRKKKNSKSKVSFGADVGGGTAATQLDTIEPEELRETSRKAASMQEILLPFREPKAPDRIPSLNSDIKNSGHQHNVPMDEMDAEADYMDDSDIEEGELDEMEEMTADPLEDSYDNDYLATPQIAGLANQGEPENVLNHYHKTATINTSSLGTNVMPTMQIPDLDKSRSARNANRGITPHGINRMTLVGGSNTSNSDSNNYSNSNSLPRNKNNHDTNHSNEASATTASTDSAERSKELRQVQQQHQHYPQQNQQQYYPQPQPQPQPQPTPHEIQSEQTRELVKIFIGEIWNRGEIESIQKVCSPRLRFNGHTGLERVGHDGFSRMVATVRSSLEGYHCEIHSMVVEGRKCFCRLKFTGKHVGELMGYPPTHKLVAWMGASEFTICPRKKLILKVWELGDIKTLEAQLMG